MIVALSYVIAVVLTLILAVILYPIAAFFWILEKIGTLLVFVFDLFGKASDGMFRFTSKVIHALWKDIRNIDRQQAPEALKGDQWICSCGTPNTGKFCAECGKPMSESKEIAG